MSEIRSQATPARDELVRILAGAVLDNPGSIGTLPQHAADRILATGWSKPRTVNSVEELEALPGLSVIRDADLFDSPGDILEKWFRPTGWQWMRVGSLKFRASNEINLPATILFTPGDAG